MKKKIAILGSTGSIGKNLINIIEKEQNKFQIDLLSAHKDYKTLFKQIKKFNVKNIIISYFKRKSKIKNTGNIIPGHGGLLDRIDGMIFAFPFSYITLIVNSKFF